MSARRTFLDFSKSLWVPFGSHSRSLPNWIKEARKKGIPDVFLFVGIAIDEDVEVEWDQTRIAERKLKNDLPIDT